jgi:multicomponent Na+:H+ antiporter subunit D
MNLSNHIPILIISIPLLAAFLVPLIGRINKKATGILTTIALSVSLIFTIALAVKILTVGPQVYVFGATSPSLTLPTGLKFPIRIIFEVDAMSIFMGLITAVVSFLGAIYSLSFIKKYDGVDKYYSLLLLLTVGMFGMEFTGDMFNFFVFLEISSIASVTLISFRGVSYGEPAEAGFKYMVVSSISALMVLFAVGIFYGQYDILNLAAIARVIKYSQLDKIALGLLIPVLAMKAGAVPMHMWTPDAYSEAPAPITMILVAASQASLYALFRIVFSLYNITMNTLTIGWIIIIFGLLSMFIGVTMAIVQKDIKRLMAYHAVSQTGYMLLGVGVGLAVLANPIALQKYGITAMEGGIFHIMNHAMYKGLLFLTAGLPPFNGFASKLLIYESVYKFNPLLSIIAMVVSILTLASFVKVFHSAFLGPKLPQFKEVKEVPRSMVFAMAVLSCIIIFFGLFPDLIVKNLVHPAVMSLIEQLQYTGTVLGGM